MTDSPELRLLRDIFAEPKPCGHIDRFVAFVASQGVQIISGEDDEVAPGIDCLECDVMLTFEHFSRLLVGAMQGRS